MYYKRKVIIIAIAVCAAISTIAMSSMASDFSGYYAVNNKNNEYVTCYPRQTSGSTKKLHTNIAPSSGTTSIHVYVRNNNTGAQVGHKLFPVQTTISDLVTNMSNNLYYRVTVRPNINSYSTGYTNSDVKNS